MPRTVTSALDQVHVCGHVCTHVCMCVYTCPYMCTCVHMCVGIGTHVSGCEQVCVCVHVWVGRLMLIFTRCLCEFEVSPRSYLQKDQENTDINGEP